VVSDKKTERGRGERGEGRGRENTAVASASSLELELNSPGYFGVVFPSDERQTSQSKQKPRNVAGASFRQESRQQNRHETDRQTYRILRKKRQTLPLLAQIPRAWTSAHAVILPSIAVVYTYMANATTAARTVCASYHTPRAVGAPQAADILEVSLARNVLLGGRLRGLESAAQGTVHVVELVEYLVLEKQRGLEASAMAASEDS